MKKTFTKPSEEEITIYLTDVKHYEEEAAKLFAAKFWNWYESTGWKVGKNQMVSWHAAIRTWELNNKQNGTNRQTTQPSDKQGTSVARIEALRNW